ncbi:MAG: RiPP maturation radical SAM C-methyltransferase [Desulfobulbaceae bacterium]|nr:RiPP maturation radical SAM C-methyltransferase [Desulfobulbaceae bacterium]
MRCQPPPSPALRLALISMPWALFNRPSIQLGSLKGFLSRQPWLTVETFHPYLAVAKRLTPPVYQWISRQVWVSEALYASILFPRQGEPARRLIQRALKSAPKEARFQVDGVVALLTEELDRWLSEVAWQRFDLVGFSVCFNQLLPSLTAAHAIKRLSPATPIVFGGSTCAPNVARSLLNAFPAIDYTVSGEGELPLLDLCAHLAGRDVPLPPQVQTRATPASAAAAAAGCSAAGQLADLGQLPTPAYDDYFRQMRALFTDEPFIPELPVEFSRGCWWGKCAFCNLNLQWRGYRAKKVDQMVGEVRGLSQRFGTLDFTFTDNALPVRESVDFFKTLAGDDRDFRFFGEIRVSQRGKSLLACRQGGLRTIQAGFEALSTSLLKRINKGATVIDNLALMKDAVAAGMVADGNLIIEFPGSSEAEAEETLANLDFALPFTPLTTASFFLGQGSPVDQAPASYGLKAVVHHPASATLFPKETLARLELLIKDYRGDRGVQRQRWAGVARKVKEWQEFHRQRRVSAVEKPLLSFRDGGSFLIIRQELPAGRVLHHRLRGISREIYLFGGEIRSLAETDEAFPAISREKLLPFLRDLAMKRILFMEGERFLALAVRSR